MDSVDIAFAWRQAFGETHPQGRFLRCAFDDRWFRIHSLPLSKRYPESEADYKEMLHRHNAVASAILGDYERCILLAGFFPPTDLAYKFTVDAPIIPCLKDVIKVPPPPEGCECSLTFKGAWIHWLSGKFNAVIRNVADDVPLDIVFANPKRGAICAPYDGWADFICGSEELAQELKKQFNVWVPEGGL